MKRILIGCFALVFLAGCVQITEYTAPSMPVISPPPKGVYHKVQSGETLWRISKTYDITIDELVAYNKIPNVAQIEKDQLIFIPDAKEALEIQRPQTAEGTIDSGQDKTEFRWPLKGKVLYYFGSRKRGHLNNGIDIQTSGGEMVRAARDGRVVFADYLTGHSYMVILDHNDGYYSVYSQNSETMVDVGDYALKGTPIARVGRSGDLALLHFQIRRGSIPDNPLYYLP